MQVNNQWRLVRGGEVWYLLDLETTLEEAKLLHDWLLQSFVIVHTCGKIGGRYMVDAAQVVGKRKIKRGVFRGYFQEALTL